MDVCDIPAFLLEVPETQKGLCYRKYQVLRTRVPGWLKSYSWVAQEPQTGGIYCEYRGINEREGEVTANSEFPPFLFSENGGVQAPVLTPSR